VVSQIASLRLKEESGDLESLAKSMNIRYLLTGSVRRAGNKLRVIAELDDAIAGFQLWSDTYDRGMDDVFAVLEEIAKAIVAAAGGQLIRAKTEQAAHAAPETLDSVGLVRKAYHFTNQAYHAEALNDAVQLLRQAINLDPQYAFAHAFLAFFLIQRVVTNASLDAEADRAEALATAEHAILAAPGNPEVLENGGLVLVHCGKFEKAVATLRRAVEIAPFNFPAWGYLGLALGWAGNAEQMREAYKIFERLIANAPDHPSLPYWLCFKAGTLGREGRHQEAAEAAARGVMLQPRFAPGLVEYANALGYLGRVDDARDLAGRMVAANPNGTQEAYMKELLITTGSRQRAETHIGGLIAAGIFKGDVPWPTPLHHDTNPDRASKSPASA
jgi:adenylate cyclase